MGIIQAQRVWIGVWLVWLSAWIAAEGTPTATNTSYNEFRKCGPNSLFVFLILSGCSNVTFSELEDIAVSSKGTSLLALRDAAKRFHIEAEVRRYHPAEVGSLPLPAIGQFKNNVSSITPHHFDVIYKVEAERVYLVNGTTGLKESIRRSKLPQFWTGFAIVEKRSLAARVTNKWSGLLAACVLIADLVIFAFWFRRRKIRRSDKS